MNKFLAVCRSETLKRSQQSISSSIKESNFCFIKSLGSSSVICHFSEMSTGIS